MKGEVLVAGIGNIFLGDDAFGVEVVNRLRTRALPDHVKIVDFGMRSYDLAYALMEDWDLIILVDALPRGNEPGTLYTMRPELPATTEAATNLDAHMMNPVAVLQLVRALGGRPASILVVGCEPGNVEPDEQGTFALSPPVQAAVGEAIRTIGDLISRSKAIAA